MEERLTKQEKKEQRKQEWQEKLEKEQKSKTMKKVLLWVGVIIVLVGGFWALNAATTYSPSPAQVNTTLPPVSATDIATGNKNAKVTVIEYEDFQCPGCAAAEPVTNQLLKDFTGKLLFVHRFFPLTSIHKNAMASAEAGYAAYKQNKFWEMRDLLFTNQQKWAELDDPTSVFLSYAQTLNLNIDQFKKDMLDPKTKAFIDDEENKGTEAGVQGTPTFFMNKKQVSVTNYSGFKQQIQQELSKG